MTPTMIANANRLFLNPELAGDAPVPARIRDGIVATCWELDDTEIERICATGRIFLVVPLDGSGLAVPTTIAPKIAPSSEPTTAQE